MRSRNTITYTIFFLVVVVLKGTREDSSLVCCGVRSVGPDLPIIISDN